MFALAFLPCVFISINTFVLPTPSCGAPPCNSLDEADADPTGAQYAAASASAPRGVVS